jgi:DNA end-binding protein Ku
MATRSLWSGTISFGLVSIPVELHPAVSQKEVHFHMLHKSDGGRVHQKLVCEKDGKEISRKDVVKGYELQKHKYVEVDTDELKRFTPEATRSIDISDFVKQEEIDPVYYEHSYHVRADKGGAKAYALLLEAMKQSGRVGIATMVMRTKGYLCALRPTEQGLMLATMQYPDEILSADSGAGRAKPTAKELAMAQQLIESLAGPFEPSKYKDAYRESVLTLIRKKAKGQVIEEPEPETPRQEITDLAEALSRSIANQRRPQRRATRHRARQKRRASSRR